MRSVVVANKVVVNALDWPGIVSYFEYDILMYDEDGNYNSCPIFGGSGLISGFPGTCAVGFCDEPLASEKCMLCHQKEAFQQFVGVHF